VNTHALLESLRSQKVHLRVDGGRLVVDVPVGAIIDEIRTTLAQHKSKLLKLFEWERRKLKEADRRGLVIRWSEHPGWIKLHDPTVDEWHELWAADCFPSLVEKADGRCKKRATLTKETKKGGVERS
jgi:hypothetical protein